MHAVISSMVIASGANSCIAFPAAACRDFRMSVGIGALVLPRAVFSKLDKQTHCVALAVCSAMLCYALYSLMRNSINWDAQTNAMRLQLY